MRTTFSSGLAIEEQVGYSRAVRVGDVLYVSATAPVDDQQKLVGTTGYEQADYIFSKIAPVLDEAGFSFAEVVFARLYIADAEKSSSVYQAFKERLDLARPALAVVNVLPWSIEGMLVEIELTLQKDS